MKEEFRKFGKQDFFIITFADMINDKLNGLVVLCMYAQGIYLCIKNLTNILNIFVRNFENV